MSKKIGRNDPCPCGSGKKYKHCCGNKAATAKRAVSESKKPKKLEKLKESEKSETPAFNNLSIMRFEQRLQKDPKELEQISKEIAKISGRREINFNDFIQKSWSLEKVRKMSTLEIVQKLKSLNVDFDTELFKEQAQNYISAIQLSEDHYYTQDFHAPGLEEDFIWLAIIELWNRILPEKYNMEMIDDAIQDGYNDIEVQNYAAGIEKWEKAWDMIKSIVPSNIKSVKGADKFLPDLTQSLINWCQDFEIELGNAAIKDTSFHARRIKYCQDFRRVFPDSNKSIIKNMLNAEAESYTELGDQEAAEKLLDEPD
jgi:hypothetical protein